MSMQDFSMRRILHGLGKNTKNELSFEQKKFRQGVYSVEDNNVGHIILYPLDPILSCIPEVSYEDNKEVDSENLKKTISIILRPLTGYLIKNNLYPIYSTYSDIRKYLRQILSMTICEDGVNNTS
jgi:hypothetical protein